MKTTNLVRTSFLDYFQKLDHQVVPSGPLVPQNDPSLLFTSAGMVPFKDVFLGREKRPYTRATSAQKCLRAGGKHNDLENVGQTPRHHTFFEMLGNFSFGDYFKEKAIFDAWTFVTKELGLPKNKLTMTVYHEDDESFSLWKKIANPDSNHLIRISTDDNFWSAGDSGPCGPCSEIFYDLGPSLHGGPPGSPTGDGDRFMEIWNLVFMQYLQTPGAKERTYLPTPCVDTGMGLERISSVLQGVTSNFDTDIFQGLIQGSIALTGVPYEGVAQVSHRIIADHIRAISFLIADGVLPTNEGRGYVLRRILRRAVRHAHLLNAKEPLLARLFPYLSNQMGLVYPELLRAADLIQETVTEEECRFQETLTKGLKVLESSLETLPPTSHFPGKTAFKLYDTYGFPLDLTQDILKASHREVDVLEFDRCMDEQKATARAAWSGSGETAQEELWYDLLSKHGPTHFMGYGSTEGEGILQAIIHEKKITPNLCASPKNIEVLLNQTPFYGESGGQLGDTGTLTVLGSDGSLKGHMKITNTRKYATDLIVHEGILEEGELTTGDMVKLHIDKDRRDRMSANHTATHLLHAALHELVSKTITQKGSLVAPDRLRFDFNSKEAFSPDVLIRIERWINEKIQNNSPVVTTHMSTDEALESGAMALFGQKYADQVRVVTIFESPLAESCATSKELCGGTHVAHTGSIGLFKIVSQSSISAGVRRIEAVTGLEALDFVQQQGTLLKEAATLLKINPSQLLERIQDLLKEKTSPKQAFVSDPVPLHESKKQVGEKKILGITIDHHAGLDLKNYTEKLITKLPSGIVLVVSNQGPKSTLVLGVSSDLTPFLNATDLIKEISLQAGGKGGGGNERVAQAGGKSDIPLTTLTHFLEKKMHQAFENN